MSLHRCPARIASFGLALVFILLPATGHAQSFWNTWRQDGESPAEKKVARENLLLEKIAKEQRKLALIDGELQARRILPRNRKGYLVSQRQIVVREASRLFAELIELSPEHGEANYRYANFLKTFINELPPYLRGHTKSTASPTSLRKEVKAWTQFMKAVPQSGAMTSALFARSIALTKLQGRSNLDIAIQDYSDSLALENPDSILYAKDKSTTESNQAELYMMQGQLAEAIAAYEKSLESTFSPLAAYGLAVALDRDGQRTRAREIAKQAVKHDRAGKALTSDGVFFVPAAERFYYLALRAEALQHWAEAAVAYSAFLLQLPNSPWAPQAKANKQAIEKMQRGNLATMSSRGKTIKRPR